MQLARLGEQSSGITPRWYQAEAVSATFANWAQRPSSFQIIVAPTGSGKTIMIGMVARRYLDETPGQRVLCLTDRPELVSQNYDTFRRAFPAMSAGVYAAKLGRKDKRAKVTFALVQSVANNVQAFTDVGLIIIDEVHMCPHEGDGQFRTVIAAIRARRGAAFVKGLGLSATPWRLNSGNLLEPYKGNPPLFDEISYEIDMLDLLEEGYLCKMVAKGTKTKLDTKGLHKRGDEFIEAEMNVKFNRDDLSREIAGEVVGAAIEQDRRSIIVFCVSVDHATRMRDFIRARGISCETVSVETPTAQRRNIIRDFKQYKIRCLTNVNILSTGFDHPGVDHVAMARPTNSPGLYLQQAGRGMRPHDGKPDALLQDFALNVMRHGLLTSVKGVFKKNKKDEEDDEAAVKECPSCSTIVPAGVLTCSECGYVWEKREAPDREAKLVGKNTATRVMDDASSWVAVLHATFSHTQGRAEKPGTLRLAYQVQGETAPLEAAEYFCLDHGQDSWARKKAEQEWRKRTGLQPPQSVAEALARITELRRPTKVRIVRSDCGKYWNVRGVKF